MVVNLKAKKRLASRVTGVGVHRIKFDSDHLDDIADAITRGNIRSLITANTIQIKPSELVKKLIDLKFSISANGVIFRTDKKSLLSIILEKAEKSFCNKFS